MDLFNICKSPLELERRTQIGTAVSLSETVKGKHDIALGTSLTDEQKEQVENLLSKFEDLYVENNRSIGIVPFMEHTIDTSDSQPIRYHTRNNRLYKTLSMKGLQRISIQAFKKLKNNNRG